MTQEQPEQDLPDSNYRPLPGDLIAANPDDAHEAADFEAAVTQDKGAG